MSRSKKIDTGPTLQEMTLYLRHEVGLTQAEIGLRAGLKQNTVHKMEHGAKSAYYLGKRLEAVYLDEKKRERRLNLQKQKQTQTDDNQDEQE